MTSTDTFQNDHDIREREQQLSAQLAAILARPPSRMPREIEQDLAKVSEPAFEDFDLEELSDEDFEAQSVSARAAPEITELEALDDNAPDADSQPYTFAPSTTLVKTAKRARFRRNVTQFGSWVITLAVTCFITACVSVMLLGLPSELDPRSWISARAVAPVIASPATTEPVKTNKVRTQNVNSSQ